jgi:energy-coupling factor transporter ATP-binding protein EcfA2
VALAVVERLAFAYPGGRPALDGVSLEVEPGELVLVLGPSGSGKSTLVRALAGLVPHFHGGRFAGRVEVAGLDTRLHRPAELAGTVATLFQDPEDQVVLTRVDNEVAFGLENLGVAPAEIPGRVDEALAAAGVAHLAGRPVAELSGGELQRVCLAATLALRPRLLLLDEPTSQIDPEAAEGFFELVAGLGLAVVCTEQRPARPLEHADRVVFLDGGRIALDAPRDEALAWLAEHRPAYVVEPERPEPRLGADAVCRLEGVSFAYRAGVPVVDGADLELRRGEIVALAGPNGSGKTTLAKLAAGLLEPDAGTVRLAGRAAYLSQDPGRYLVRERADEEVALAIGGDLGRARRALAAVGLAGRGERHPRDLSSGERERLALAAVAATEPDLLVLDEPTRGVDPERKAELAHLLRSEAAGRATLVVTHDLVFARAVADRTVALDDELVAQSHKVPTSIGKALRA